MAVGWLEKKSSRILKSLRTNRTRRNTHMFAEFAGRRSQKGTIARAKLHRTAVRVQVRAAQTVKHLLQVDGFTRVSLFTLQFHSGKDLRCLGWIHGKAKIEPGRKDKREF